MSVSFGMDTPNRREAIASLTEMFNTQKRTLEKLMETCVSDMGHACGHYGRREAMEKFRELREEYRECLERIAILDRVTDETEE